MYASLANGGLRAPLSPVACVIDADGNAIWRGNAADQVQGCKDAKTASPLLINPEQAKPAVDPQATYLITSILSDLEARRPAFGSAATLLSLPDRPAAAKTGTTNDNRDGWTLGYTPDLAVGVWVGNADYSPMKDVAGSVGAAPVWHNVMARGLEGVPPKPFPVPPGIQRIKVCADSGTLPSEACPNQREEVFAVGRGPLPARFDLHQRLRIDKMTGQLATDFTPPDRVETKDAVIFPPRYKAWANAHGYPQPDLNQKQYAFPPELTINSPGQNARAQGTVQVMGRVHLPEPLVWRLEYGVGPSPVGWGVLNGPQTGDVDGAVGDWDTAKTVAKHDTNDFSLRLAAYEPGNLDYPVAVSNVVYVSVEEATPTAEPPTATPSPRATETPTDTPEATETPTPPNTAIPTETPAATVSPTDSPTPEPGRPTDTATAEPSTSNAVSALITEPADRAQVSGPVAIMGEAAGPGFRAYLLQFAAGAEPAADAWQAIQPPQTEPSTAKGGLLGIWQTANVPPGIYAVRLVVLDAAGETHFASTIVNVTATGQ